MSNSSHARPINTLFPTALPELEWLEFSAEGFSKPVSGLIHRTAKPPCCGLPLGGISTGCLDIEVAGVLGYSSIFNPAGFDHQHKAVIPRQLPGYQPFLGLSVGGQTWVLTTQKILDGGEAETCTDPMFTTRRETVTLPRIEGVRAAREIHYWGHYPVADLEFETDAPVSVGLRAWAPFLPGDAEASNTPGAIFELHLRNLTDARQKGTIAFSFPGPSEEEAGTNRCARHPALRNATQTRQAEQAAGRFTGVAVSGEKAGYALGVIGKQRLRLGGALGPDGAAWAGIGDALPAAAPDHRGASAAADFSLAPGKSKTVRFVLAWFAPEWQGANENRYTHMYASRYGSALEVAEHLARRHRSLLRRVLAWQQAVYATRELPVWLRETLVNNLALIAECSYWAMAKPPLGDWCAPQGLFGLNESPRGCPQIECIPCSWYGNLPIVYFFPGLARSTLRAYTHHMRDDSAAPFQLGKWGLPDFLTPSWDWQVTLNGPCYVDLVARLWLRSGDDAVLREFYPSVKRNTTFTMNLRPGPEGVISMPAGDQGMEWFERGEWLGMCAHLGGLHLSNLRVAQRMAEAMGDQDFVRQCREWFDQGSAAMEQQMWTGSYYLNYYDPETGKKSDDVMAYQLDGQWAADFFGLPGVFRADRVKTTLATIRRCNAALTPHCGAANFARPDGAPLPSEEGVAAYGIYAMFPPEVLILAMTYMYAGERAFGLELARGIMHNMVCKHRHAWDLPNIVRGDSGERGYGTDYYQNMILWALPAALEGKDLCAPLRPGGLVDRVLKAARRK